MERNRSRYERRLDYATRAEFGIRNGSKTVVVLALCRPSCPAHRGPFHRTKRIMREHCVLPPRTRQDLVELEAQTRRAQPPLVYTSLGEISAIRVEREREREKSWIAIDYADVERSFSAPFPISREPGLGVHGSQIRSG